MVPLMVWIFLNSTLGIKMQSERCNSLSEKSVPEGNKHMTSLIYIYHTYEHKNIQSILFINKHIETPAPKPGAELLLYPVPASPLPKCQKRT